MSEHSPPQEKNDPAIAHHNPVAKLISRMSIMQLTLVVVLALFLWQWLTGYRQTNDMQQELARRLAEMEGNNRASQVLAMQGLESVRELAAKVSLLETRYAEAQNQRAALEALYQDFSSS